MCLLLPSFCHCQMKMLNPCRAHQFPVTGAASQGQTQLAFLVSSGWLVLAGADQIRQLCDVDIAGFSHWVGLQLVTFLLVKPSPQQ